MPGTVTLHSTRFREDDVYEGDYPRDDTRTDVHDELTAREAVDLIRREGLSFAATGSDWAADPDGSRVVDYSEGIREETTAHLSDFPPRVAAAIRAAVDARP